MERKSTAAALPVPDQVAGCFLSRPVAVLVLAVMLFLALRFWKLTPSGVERWLASMIGAKQPISQFGTYTRPKPLEKSI